MAQVKLYKPTSQKWREVLGSGNALTTFLALIVLLFSQAGVELPSENPEEYFGQLEGLVTAFILWVVNPIRSFIKKIIDKEITWKYLTDSNIVTAFVSVVGVILGLWFSEETVATLTLILANALNFLFQMFFKPAKLATK